MFKYYVYNHRIPGRPLVCSTVNRAQAETWGPGFHVQPRLIGGGKLATGLRRMRGRARGPLQYGLPGFKCNKYLAGYPAY